MRARRTVLLAPSGLPDGSKNLLQPGSSDTIAVMAKGNVRFIAVRTEKKPTRVRFKTKSGETVSFKALKTTKKREVVRFRAKKR